MRVIKQLQLWCNGVPYYSASRNKVVRWKGCYESGFFSRRNSKTRAYSKSPLGKSQRLKIPLKSFIAALNRPKAALRRSKTLAYLKNPLEKSHRPKIPLKSLIAAFNRPRVALRRSKTRAYPKNPLGKSQRPKISLKSLFGA